MKFKFNPFALPTAEEKVKADLAIAKLSLLDAHTNVELAKAQLAKNEADLNYQESRVERLKTMLQEAQV